MMNMAHRVNGAVTWASGYRLIGSISPITRPEQPDPLFRYRSGIKWSRTLTSGASSYFGQTP